MDTEPQFHFTSLSEWVVSERPGRGFAVANPIKCRDFAHLLGALVTVDGARYRVRGVERHPCGFAFYDVGEPIGLLVEAA